MCEGIKGKEGGAETEELVDDPKTPEDESKAGKTGDEMAPGLPADGSPPGKGPSGD